MRLMRQARGELLAPSSLHPVRKATGAARVVIRPKVTRGSLQCAPPGDGRGFMYVEVLLALALLAIALLAVVPMFILATHGNAASGDLTFAATLAHDKTESLLAAGYDSLSAGVYTECVQVRDMQYLVTWTILDETPHPGMREVIIQVVPRRKLRLGPARNVEVMVYVVP